MFAKLSALALLIPFVNALTLQAPDNIVSAGRVTITWTKDPSDDVFSLFLYNRDVFHNSFAIANNVNPADQSITLTLPVVQPGDGYTFAATNITNVDNIYDETAPFPIAPSPSTSVTSSSTSAASSSASGSASGSVTGSASASGASTTAISTSTSRFGITVSNTASSSASSGASGSGSGSASSSAASASASNFNGAPASLIGAGANQLAALAFAVVAGGAVLL